MKKNNFFIVIVFGSFLFSGASFGMESQPKLSGQQTIDELFIKSSDNQPQSWFRKRVENVQDLARFSLFMVGASLLVGPHYLFNAWAYNHGAYNWIDFLRLKMGPYLPMKLSYVRQIESELKLIRAEKERNGLPYSIEDCFSDMAKIINECQWGSPLHGHQMLLKYYDRNADIRKKVLESLLQKYESFLPGNITKDDWVQYLRASNFDFWHFKQLTKRYKDNRALEDAMRELVSEKVLDLEQN